MSSMKWRRASAVVSRGLYRLLLFWMLRLDTSVCLPCPWLRHQRDVLGSSALNLSLRIPLLWLPRAVWTSNYALEVRHHTIVQGFSSCSQVLCVLYCQSNVLPTILDGSWCDAVPRVSGHSNHFRRASASSCQCSRWNDVQGAVSEKLR